MKLNNHFDVTTQYKLILVILTIQFCTFNGQVVSLVLFTRKNLRLRLSSLVQKTDQVLSNVRDNFAVSYSSQTRNLLEISQVEGRKSVDLSFVRSWSIVQRTSVSRFIKSRLLQLESVQKVREVQMCHGFCRESNKTLNMSEDIGRNFVKKFGPCPISCQKPTGITQKMWNYWYFQK